MESKERILQKIAEQELGLKTLESRGSDALDFSDQPVWSIREALAAAYEVGKSMGISG